MRTRQAATTIPTTAGVDMPAPVPIDDVDLVSKSSSSCDNNNNMNSKINTLHQLSIITFVTVVSSTVTASSVVVRNIIIVIVSMETGGEVVAMTVGDGDIDEPMTTSTVVGCRIRLISVNLLTEVLPTARSPPVIPILGTGLMLLLLGVGIISTVVVDKVLESAGDVVERGARDSEVDIMAEVEGVIKVGDDSGDVMGSDVLTTTASEITNIVLAWTDVEVESKIKLDFDGKIERLEVARNDDEPTRLLDDCRTEPEDCELVGRC